MLRRALALTSLVHLTRSGEVAYTPVPLECSDEYGRDFANLMDWIEEVCVNQLNEAPPRERGSGPSSCVTAECARLVARVEDGCHSWFSDGFGAQLGKMFRPLYDMCVEGTAHGPRDPPAPPVYAITDTAARGYQYHEHPIDSCAGVLNDGFDHFTPPSLGQNYAVLRPPPGQKLRVTATEMYLAKGNLRVGHGRDDDWQVGDPWMGTGADNAGRSFAGDVGDPVRVLFVIDPDDAKRGNSFDLAISCECVDASSCGAHGKCRDGVCECSGGYQLLNGTCDDASCVGIDCGGEEQGRCYSGKCLCKLGWTGSDCSEPDPCSEIACEHGGTCEPDLSGSRPTATCHCASEYTGARCEQVDRCASVWCGSHGACVDGACECRDGYSGPECMDDCGSLVRNNPLVGVVRTNSPHVAATGCTPGRDTCLLESCAADVSGCTLARNGVGGLPFACIVNGIGAECFCVPPLYPCNVMFPRGQPGGRCGGHGQQIGDGKTGCSCTGGWSGSCCTEPPGGDGGSALV
jgi:hypothetical protein